MNPPDPVIASNDLILVTGSNGFLGRKVVERLLACGFRRLRCFVRPTSDVAKLVSIIKSFHHARVQMMSGNLVDIEDCRRAVAGAVLLVHCAAGKGGSLVNMFVDSVLASRNLLDAIVEQKTIRRIVHVSSFAVYGTAALNKGELLTEKTPLEMHHALRNEPYAYVKHKQEQLFWKYSEQYNLPLVVIRPGSIFGPGGDEISSRVGIEVFSFFVHLGGSNAIPLTYVDNCAEAIVLACTRSGIEGQVFNIHDDDLPSCRDYLRLYKKVKKNIRFISVPYFAVQGACRILSSYSRFSRGQIPAVITPYRAATTWKGVNFDNTKAKKVLGWTPRVPMSEALKIHFEFIRRKSLVCHVSH